MFISHISALEFWRKHRALPEERAERLTKITLPNTPPTTGQVRRTGLTLPVHITICSPIARWLSKTMQQHVLTDKVIPGCFLEVKDGLWVSSPEFCFLQMAGFLSLAQLIELGYEICGEYSLPVANDPNPPDRGFYYRKQLTSINRIGKFLANMPGAKGCQKAKRALRYLNENSASPMETKLSILLTLPYLLGGFGLIAPELNSRITPSKTERISTSKNFYTCDLFWPEYNLAAEYDSVQHHTGSNHINSDAKKKNSLILMGVTVITVTKQQLYRTRELEKVARILATRMGKRLRFKKNSFYKTHRELRKQLF